MKFPTVEHCCCCISLRAGCILMGIVGVLGSMVSILSGTAVLVNVIGLLVCSWWIYGILKENPKLMLPALILSFIGVVTIFVSPVFIIFYYFATKSDDEEKDVKMVHMYSIACVGVYCIGVISAYFFVVQYSLYRMIKGQVPVRNPHHIQVQHKNGV